MYILQTLMLSLRDSFNKFLQFLSILLWVVLSSWAFSAHAEDKKDANSANESKSESSESNQDTDKKGADKNSEDDIDPYIKPYSSTLSKEDLYSLDRPDQDEYLRIESNEFNPENMSDDGLFNTSNFHTQEQNQDALQYEAQLEEKFKESALDSPPASGEKVNAKDQVNSKENAKREARVNDVRVPIDNFIDLENKKDTIDKNIVITNRLYFSEPTASHEWLQSGNNPANKSFNLAFNGNIALKRLWAVSVGNYDSGELISSPIIGYGLVYTVDVFGRVNARDKETGKLIWSNKLYGSRKPQVAGSLALGTLLYAVDGFGGVYGMDPINGEVIWWQSIDLPVSAPIAVKNEVIYVTNQASRIYAIDGNTGGVIWSKMGSPQNRIVMNYSSPVIGRSNVVVPFSSGQLLTLSRNNGEEIWSKNFFIKINSGNSNLLPIIYKPIIDDITGSVFYSSHSNEVGRLDLRTGKNIWSHSVSMPNFISLVDNNLFVITRDERLMVFDSRTGTELWNKILPKTKKRSFIEIIKGDYPRVMWLRPMVIADTIWLISEQGHLLVYASDTGELLNSQKLIINSNELVASPPSWVDGTLYIITKKGRLMAWR